MRRQVLTTLLFFATLCLAAGTERFSHIRIHRHRSAENRVLVDKFGKLTFDDANRKLIFEKTVEDKFDVPERVEVEYDSAPKVVFEITTHMRGGGLAQVVSAIPSPIALAASVIADQHVDDYWYYLAYRTSDQDEAVLLDIPKSSSRKIIDKTIGVFGSRAVVNELPEKGESVEPEKLADFKSKQVLKVDKQNRPVPEARADKATIVVVCPPLAARDSGKGNQFKLHANDRVVAVNKAGTYSFAYLEPGRYRLISRSANANGFEMELEGGKTYYFLQNTFQGVFKWETKLSRNSAELVTYLLMSGTYFSDWSRK
jgi:hypothetical protein